MRKRFSALLLASVLVLSLTACGNSQSQIDEPKIDEPKVDYDKEFDALMERIEGLSEHANYVSSANTLVWQEVGPSEVSDKLSIMLSARERFDLIDEDEICGAFRAGYSGVWPYIEKYQEGYEALSNELDLLKADIKALKDACGDDHADGIAALQNYYIKLQAYAEFALEPSGNLMNYHSNHESFENDMAELKAAAEFDK